MNLAFLIILLSAILNGCVSIGYHQKKVAEVKQEERTKATLLAEQVRDKRMTIKDMLKLLNYREGK